VDYALTQAIDLRGVFTWQRGQIRDGSLGFVDYSSDIVAPLRLTAAVDARPTETLSVSLQATYYGEADFFSPGELSLGRVATDEVLLVDASARYSLGRGYVFVGASNLLDEEYVNVAGQASGAFAYYRAEGRRVTVGFRGDF
jgi:iron complex outermembrane receptor protein